MFENPVPGAEGFVAQLRAGTPVESCRPSSNRSGCGVKSISPSARVNVRCRSSSWLDMVRIANAEAISSRGSNSIAPGKSGTKAGADEVGCAGVFADQDRHAVEQGLKRYKIERICSRGNNDQGSGLKYFADDLVIRKGATIVEGHPPIRAKRHSFNNGRPVSQAHRRAQHRVALP